MRTATRRKTGASDEVRDIYLFFLRRLEGMPPETPFPCGGTVDQEAKRIRRHLKRLEGKGTP